MTGVAFLEALGLGAAFAGAMYLWPNERQSLYARDKPYNIRRRLVSMCGVCVAGLVYYRHKSAPSGERFVETVADLMVGHPENHASLPSQIGSAVSLTGVLFLGVLATHAVERYQRIESVSPVAHVKDIVHELRSNVLCWTGLRNYIAAPAVEELYFRAIVFRLLRGEGPVSTWRLLTLSSVVFASAHLHHMYRYYWENITCDFATRQVAIKRAVQRSMMDFAITFTFGYFGGFIFLLNRESVLAATVGHMLCNYLGAPGVDHLRFKSPTKHVVSLLYLVGIAGFVAQAVSLSRSGLQ